MYASIESGDAVSAFISDILSESIEVTQRDDRFYQVTVGLSPRYALHRDSCRAECRLL